MKMKIKSIAIIMAFVLLVSSFTVFTAGAEGIDYSVTSVSGKKGETVTVSVKLSTDIDLWGANLMLGYNPAELEVVECKTGDAANSSSLYNSGSSVNFSGMFASKKGVVFTVEFKILKSKGTAKLTLTSTENTDIDGKTHQCTITQGKVTILPDSAVLGDVNNDGMATAVDARVVLQHVAGIKSLTSSQMALTDMNGDGDITAVDARIILQKVVGLK